MYVYNLKVTKTRIALRTELDELERGGSVLVRRRWRSIIADRSLRVPYPSAAVRGTSGGCFSTSRAREPEHLISQSHYEQR